MFNKAKYTLNKVNNAMVERPKGQNKDFEI